MQQSLDQQIKVLHIIVLLILLRYNQLKTLVTLYILIITKHTLPTLAQ